MSNTDREMIMSTFHWFWPGLSLLLTILWLWTLLRQRRAAPTIRTSPTRWTHWPVEAEDALKAAYTLQETEGTWDDEELVRSLGLSATMARGVTGALLASGWAEEDAQGNMHLTEAGETRARELIRAHRLWERYLVDREGMPLEAVHAEAHRREHETTPEELERLDAELGHPAWDPHGHAIPASGSRVPSPAGRSLLEEGRPGNRLRIVCLDDEPAVLLAQLVALGLKPGRDVEVVEREPDLLRLRVDGNVVPLASAAARHVFVIPAPALPVPLGELPVGSQTRVVDILGGGKHQRRMLDMGFVPGAEVAVIRKAPLGDPVEYRIKGTAVALRWEDADTVLVEELGNE
jgi:Fe2+ transport system protein FeoA/Mn-dependent DtxR family transcriptional regulator